MSKEEYLKQLQKYLKKLSSQDYEDAMEYFTEYFEETDEEGAKELMNELGTPKEAARDLISNLLDRKLEEQVSESETPKVIEMESLLDSLPCNLCGTDWCTACNCFPCSRIIIGNLSWSHSTMYFYFCILFFLVGAKLFIRGILAIPFSVPGFAIISGSGLFVVGLGILSIILGVALAKGIGLLFVKLAKWVSGRSKEI